MYLKTDFDIFVGGKSGIFKGIKIEKKTCIAKNIQNLVSLTRNHEITSMVWADDNEKDILLGCGSTGDRSVKIYDSHNSEFSCSLVCNAGEGKINGILRYDDAVVTAVESGQVNLWRSNDDNQLLFEAGANLNKMRHSSVNRNIIATGGKEHKLQLFDLETQKRVFEEKNVRHDWLELKVPLWISDIGFFSNNSQIATCSRYGHIRLYDIHAQRRPVVDLEMKEQALVSMAIAPQENCVVVGTGKGIMNLVDLRKPGKILNTYKDFVGSVTSIQCTKLNSQIVSVSLDRYLRIHDMKSKKLSYKTYLTSRLSCLLLRSGFTLQAQADGDDDVVNIE